MSKSQLSPLQEEILAAFFRREQRFFLTGGAALAGFHLGHRRTADLDLFTTHLSTAGAPSTLDAGDAALRAAAEELGATVENLQTSPDFRRRQVTRGADRVVVDLVLERVVQGYPDKPVIGDIRIDPPEEILANKLCALLSRSEPRDLVDVYALERTGLRVEQALQLAVRKDSGLTPAQLAWVLSEIQIAEDARVPGGISPDDLRDFLEKLIGRLTRLAYPEKGQSRA